MARTSRAWEKFLEPSRIAVVATIHRSGMPHLTPNWFVYEGDRIAISTTKERIKYRNLSHDPRMSVCIYSELTAVDYVTVSGPVSVSDDESIWPVTRLIIERYVPAGPRRGAPGAAPALRTALSCRLPRRAWSSGPSPDRRLT